MTANAGQERRLLRRILAGLIPVFLLCAIPATVDAGESSGMLGAYVSAPDDSFAWEYKGATEVPAEPPYTRHTLEMQSQTWRDIPWRHNILVFVPAKVEQPETVMLVIGGGVNRSEGGAPRGAASPEAFMLPAVATRGRAIVALLSQVPNQPILGGLNEDQAIAHSFSQYLATGEEDWPLLLPMTKSAVRAMDTVEAFAGQELGVEVEDFMVVGASKRGWTTWLTAAVDDRVAAIAPLVIDNLNIEEQMPHQLNSWGDYSPSIADYTKLNLQQELGSRNSRGERLLRTIDPYFYRERLELPKLVQSGTNDPYWVVDASRHYFPELRGEKYLHFSPNTGHSIDLNGIMSIGGFFHFVRSEKRRPKFDWHIASLQEGEALTVTHNDPPVAVKVWSAEAPERDFRQAQWTAREMEHSGDGAYQAMIEAPETGYRAYYAELVYEVEPGVNMGLCTEMRVLGGPDGPDAL